MQLPEWLDEIKFDETEDDIKRIVDRLFPRNNLSWLIFITCFLKCDRFIASKMYYRYCKVYDRELRIKMIMHQRTGFDKYEPIINEYTIFARTLAENYHEILDAERYMTLEVVLDLMKCHRFDTTVKVTSENFSNFIFVDDIYTYVLCRTFVTNHGIHDQDKVIVELDAKFDKECLLQYLEKYKSHNENRLRFIKDEWRNLPITLNMGTIKTKSLIQTILDSDASETDMLKDLFRAFKFNDFPISELKSINEKFYNQVIHSLGQGHNNRYHDLYRFYENVRNVIQRFHHVNNIGKYAKCSWSDFPHLLVFVYSCDILRKKHDPELREMIDRFMSNFNLDDIIFKIVPKPSESDANFDVLFRMRNNNI